MPGASDICSIKLTFPSRKARAVASAAGEAGLQEGLAAARNMAVEFAEYQPLHRPGLANDPGTVDRGCDITHAPHDLRGIETGPPVTIFQHAVLKGNDRGVRFDHGPYPLQDRFGVPQLHRDQHEIGDTHPRWIVGGLHGGDVKRLRAAFHPDPLRLHTMINESGEWRLEDARQSCAANRAISLTHGSDRKSVG